MLTENYYFGGQHCKYTDIFLTITLALIITGRFVPIAYISLNYLMVSFDYKHGISTLATTVSCMTSFTLLGNYLSSYTKPVKLNFITNLEMRLNKFIKFVLPPRTVHFYAFFSYAVCSTCALFFHLNDSFWLSGRTLAEVLTSSYLCRFHTPFILVKEHFPSLLYFYSIFGVIGQTIFQLLILFSLFSKFIHRFTKYWGWIFIINCAVFLQLSHLPFVEIILWISLFHGYSGLWFIKKNRFNPTKYFNRSSLVLTSITICFLFFFFNFPILGRLSNYINFKEPDPFFFKVFGLDIPYVFNSEDLRMSNHWYVLHRVNEPSEDLINRKLDNNNIDSFIIENCDLVPITNSSGEKCFYQLSDLLYYGNTLWYRRFLTGRDILESHKPGSYFSNLIEARILFDYRFCRFNSEKHYIGEFYTKDLSTGDKKHKIMFRSYFIATKDHKVKRVF